MDVLLCLLFWLTSIPAALSAFSVTEQLRLVSKNERTSFYFTAGRLEIIPRYYSQWGTVCNKGFTYTAADIACRQLGYSSYITYGTVGDYGLEFDPAPSSTPIWLDNTSCGGYESSLGDCLHNPFGSHNCDHSDDVAISCIGNGALRLQPGPFAGRLEIYYSGIWGNVCHDFFKQTDADVACRQLGYDNATNYGTVESLGYSQQSSRITWLTLDDVGCTTSDVTLGTCSHRGYGAARCDSNEEVALVCHSSAEAPTSLIRSGSVRLVTKNELTSSNLTAGRLEVYYNGQWGTVCGDGFSSQSADVACHQLGFQSAIWHATTGQPKPGQPLKFDPASSVTPIWLNNVNCSAELRHSTLDSCRHNTIGVHNCSHRNDVTISCLGNGALRLSPGPSAGLLLIYYNGYWGTVCEDSFDHNDAQVACRQLGYDTAINQGVARKLGYNQATAWTEIWLDEVECTSSELTLSSCVHAGFGLHNCEHREDVAIVCSSSLSAGAIAGITIGVLIALCCIGIILCCAVCYCVYRNKSGSSSHYVTTPSYPLAQHISTATATVSNTGSSSSLYTYTNKMTTAAYPLAPPTSTATAANNTDNNMIEKFGIPAGPQQPPRPYPFGNQYSSPNAIPLPKTVAPKAPYSSGNASTAAPHSRQ